MPTKFFTGGGAEGRETAHTSTHRITTQFICTSEDQLREGSSAEDKQLNYLSKYFLR
jgi:YD repeat-containing protein